MVIGLYCIVRRYVFFFNDTAPTEIYTLSLHDALPIWPATAATQRPPRPDIRQRTPTSPRPAARRRPSPPPRATDAAAPRSEEHTSELQSRQYLVCRLLLEKKKTK